MKNKNNDKVSTTIQKQRSRIIILLILWSLISFSLFWIVFFDPEKEMGWFEIVFYGFSLAPAIAGALFLLSKNKGKLETQSQKHSKLLKLIEGPLITLCLISTLLLGLEIGFRILARSNPIRRLYWYTMKVGSEDYSSLINNPIYTSTPYGTTAFFEESLEPINHNVIFDPETGLVLPQDFSGNYINVNNHVRRTTNQPETYQHTIYIFGGSTVFNIEVPDEYTLASLLQKSINQQMPEKYRVMNYGVIGITTSQQLKRLKSLDLQPGDIVLFFDGFNEIVDHLHREHSTLYYLIGKFYFFNYLIEPIIPQWVPAFKLKNPEGLADNYEDNIQQAHAETVANEALFFHFLQPSLFAIEDPSDHEQMLFDTIRLYSRGWQDGFEQGYDQLIGVQQALQAEGLQSFDFHDILSHQDRGYDQEIFLDDIHVNHYGNQIIIEHLMDVLKDYLSKE